MVIGTLYFAVFQYDSSRVLTYLAIVPVLGAPMLLRRTKYELGTKELFYYYCFVFLAYFLGSVVNLYNVVWWFDIFTHFLSGIFTFGVGIFLLSKMGILKENKVFSIFVGLCFVMFIASLWELFEFGADQLLGMDLQHNIDTGVHDSMIDMFVAFVGGILSSVGYLGLKK